MAPLQALIKSVQYEERVGILTLGLTELVGPLKKKNIFIILGRATNFLTDLQFKCLNNRLYVIQNSFNPDFLVKF